MRFKIKIIIVLILFSFCAKSFGGKQEKLESLIDQIELSKKFSKTDSAQKELEDSLNSYSRVKALSYWKDLAVYSNKSRYYFAEGYCYYNLAIRLNNEGDYTESIKNYQNSQQIFETIDCKAGLARVHNGLGIVFKTIGNFDYSLDHYTKSAKLFLEMNELRNAGLIYHNLGKMYLKKDSIGHAKDYIEESIHILEEYNDPVLLNCYINLGSMYNKAEQYDLALYYYQKAYKLSKNRLDTDDRFQANYKLGRYYFEQGKIAEADSLLIEAENIMESSTNNNIIAISDRSEFSLFMSVFYRAKEDFKNAYLFLNKYTVFEEENKSEQAVLNMISQGYEKMQDKLDKKRKRRDYAIAITLAGLIFSLLYLFSLYRSYQHKKKANRLLTEMDELKTRLYSNITHELRTPLTLILGPLEQMLSSGAHEKPSWKQVEMMRKNANTLLNLINQMLDLSKIEAKNLILELVEEDINKFLRTRFSAFASLTEQKAIFYQYSLLKEKNIQIFDPHKLEKIINNLVSNAIKFTPKNNKISCYANFPKQNSLELIIEDSGKGIPKNEMENIFNRFHQVKSSELPETIGTGIGLALTKELVELMHGKIKVESELEKGSKFTVTIPLGTEHLASEEFHLVKNHNQENYTTSKTDEFIPPNEECGNNKDIDTKNSPHVLVVEDHLDIREFITENLKDCFNVEQAENGNAGFQKAVENIPDLVITDVVMPEMGGIELCKNLKTDERTGHIPVIILTGKSSTEDRLKGLGIGADAYLTKPFNIKELKLRVQKLIEQRQKLRKRFTLNLNLEPKDIAVTTADEKFISRAMEIIEKNISNADFEVKQFQEEIYMSRMQLFRKIKALTNQTPSEFIRTIRLKRAAQLMDKNFGNIAQITFEVGFNNPSYFAKCFKELYGQLPSEYIKNKGSSSKNKIT